MLGQKLLTVAAAVLGFGLLVAGRTIPPSFQHLEDRVSQSPVDYYRALIINPLAHTSKIPNIKVMDSFISPERTSRMVSQMFRSYYTTSTNTSALLGEQIYFGKPA